MATINDILSSNPHNAQIESIVQYLNASGTPFEKAMVALDLYTRAAYWGSAAMPLEPPPVLGAVNNPGIATQNANYQINPEVGRSVIRRAASNMVGVPNPDSPAVRAFRDYLRGIDMQAANAWIDFNHAVDVFYEVVDPISYFLNDYEGGMYQDLFLDMLGLYKRPNAALEGVQVTKYQDGVPGASPRAAQTAITVGEINAGLASDYFVLYKDPSTRYVVYFIYDGMDTPPILTPPAGYSDIYIGVVTGAAATPTELRNAIATAVSTEGWDGIIGLDPGQPAVGFTHTLAVDPFIWETPETVFALDGTWSGLFQAATTESIPPIPELFTANYQAAVPDKLAGRWFQVEHAFTATVYTFWYSYDGVGDEPVVAGTDTYIEIPLALGETRAGVAAKTDDAILNAVAGIFAFALQTSNDLVSVWVNPFFADANDPNPGTAGTYNGADIIMRSASDDSIINDNVDLVDFKAWQTNNNDLRATYDAAFDAEFYLSSIYENSKFGLCKNPATHSVYRFFQHNIEVARMPFNRTGVLFVNTRKERCKDC